MGLDWIATDRGDGTTPEETCGMKKVHEAPEEARAFFAELHYFDGTFDEWFEANKDKYLPTTVADERACGRVTGMIAPATSFRGKILGYIPWLDEDLANRAYSDMSADEALDYAADLESALNTKNMSVERLLEKYADSFPGDDEEEDVADGFRLALAIDWLRYWGGHGHGIYAWY
jgi:hypothetical protein